MIGGGEGADPSAGRGGAEGAHGRKSFQQYFAMWRKMCIFAKCNAHVRMCIALKQKEIPRTGRRIGGQKMPLLCYGKLTKRPLGKGKKLKQKRKK